MPPPSPAPFALALAALPGVGRVTAHRILERWTSLAAVRAAPREQVLLRLRGAPHAERTVGTLFDDDAWAAEALADASAEVDGLAARGVRVLAPGGNDWPARLADLDRAERPLVLYAYGAPHALARPLMAALGRPPVAPEAYEGVQALARRVVAAGGGIALTLASGFDVALAKVSGGAAVAVAPCGLGQLAPSLRPAATQLVRGGGMLLSPFPMAHGPFEHDATEAARLAAALARAVVAAAPHDGSPEARAAVWARDHGRPLAVLPPAPAALADAPSSTEAVLAALAS